ncbi:MAG: nucleoside recognition domain-containing protein [Anaerovoracaceae bacterium]
MKDSKRYSSIYILAGIIASAAALSMVIFPAVILDSAKQGIALWAISVLPALLPFFICADFMISLGIPGIVGNFFEKPFQKLFGTPGSSAFVFIVSITSGYPMGPKLIGQLRRKGELTDREAIRMLSFCSTSGPLFMLGTVGAGMLHSPGAGAVVALSHYAAAIVNGLLVRFLGGQEKGKRSSVRTRYMEPAVDKKTMLEMLTDSIISSLKTLGVIGCYIIIFTYATDLLEMAGSLNWLKSSHDAGFVKGLLEMTIGIDEIAASDEIGLRLKCTMAAFLVSFGGLSIFAQSISVMGGLKINPFVYLKLKLSHGVFAAVIAYLSAPYILNRAVQSVGLFPNFAGAFQPGFLMQLLFSVRMLIIILILFLFTVVIELILSWRKETSD